MTTRIAVNGFGRIGRSVLRASLLREDDLEIVAVNDLADPATLAHLLRYDTVLGRLPERVEVTDDGLLVGGHKIKAFAERDPADLPWAELGIDVVIESTGAFTKAAAARKHLDAGARKVVISAPADGDDLTIAYGINHHLYDPATAPRHLHGVMHHQLPGSAGQGAARGGGHRERPDDHDPRVHPGPEPAGRPAQGPAPGARGEQQHRPDHQRRAKAIGRVLPELDGLLSGYAMRVPVITGSVTDLTVTVSRPTSVAEVNAAFRAAAEGPLGGILDYTEDPIVSSDIVTNPASCIFDAGLTAVVGNTVKVVGWYDNEWGFSERLLDTVSFIGAA